MRAVILATRLAAPDAGRPQLTSLRTLVDRPILQHVVEQAVQQGARELDVVVCERPEELRALLGDGARWGVDVRYHLARESARPVAAIQRAARGARGTLLLASGDCLVPASVPSGTGGTVVFCTPAEAGAVPSWSGLACLTPKLAEEMPVTLDEDQLGAWLIAQAHERGAVRAVHVRLSTRTAGAWVAAQRSALEGEVGGLLLGGREVEPGVWIGRGAQVHPSARLVPPVWIGEDARIEHDAAIGPGAVVGAGAMVDGGARVEAALVTAGTYLGEAVELVQSVADAGVLTHARLEATVAIADPFLVGSVKPRPVAQRAVGLVSRVLAGALLTGLAPLVLLAGAWRGLRRPPASAAPPRPSLGDLVGRVLPGLWAVVRGRVGVVGVTPRDAVALAALPEPWREACANAPVGLITEPMVQLEPDASAEAVAAADACYWVSRSRRHDAWLVRRYLGEALAAPFGHGRGRAAAA